MGVETLPLTTFLFKFIDAWKYLLTQLAQETSKKPQTQYYTDLESTVWQKHFFGTVFFTEAFKGFFSSIQRVESPLVRSLRPSSDVVLLPCRTFKIAIRFDCSLKCPTPFRRRPTCFRLVQPVTRQKHGSDSDVVPFRAKFRIY